MKVFVLAIDGGGTVYSVHSTLEGAQNRVLDYVEHRWRHLDNPEAPPMPDDPQQAVLDFYTYWSRSDESFLIEECDVEA